MSVFLSEPEVTESQATELGGADSIGDTGKDKDEEGKKVTDNGARKPRVSSVYYCVDLWVRFLNSYLV